MKELCEYGLQYVDGVNSHEDYPSMGSRGSNSPYFRNSGARIPLCWAGILQGLGQQEMSIITDGVAEERRQWVMCADCTDQGIRNLRLLLLGITEEERKTDLIRQGDH